MKDTPEIIIIGAGLVGTSLAVALSPYFRITLLEKNLPSALTLSEQDDRPISLAYGSQQILQTIGVWQYLSKWACPIQSVEVCEKGVFGAVHFSAQDYQIPALGYVVPFCELRKVLYQQMAAHKNTRILPIEKITTLVHQDGESEVRFVCSGEEQVLKAPLVVACDGTASSVRHLLNIKTTQDDHGEFAQIFKLTLKHPHQKRAYERFSEQGTLAALPMPDPFKMQLVWTYREHQKIHAPFITDAFRGRLPEIQAIEKRAQFPLKTIIAEHPVQPGLVLLGNAAHTIYPLAAQGFNLGLRDAAALSEVLVEAKVQGENWGKLNILQRYLTWRASDQQKTLRLTKGLASVFGLTLPIIKPLRGLGMLAMDLFSPLKKRLAKQTMGTAGRVPKLMRGVELSE